MIRIYDVGRDKKMSTIEVNEAADANEVAEAIYKEVRRMKALRSRDVEVTWDAEARRGAVYAGAYCVGAAVVVTGGEP